MLRELEQRFGYGLDELARQFDRSVSWVMNRLALVELIPESVQQQVRDGNRLVTNPAVVRSAVFVARLTRFKWFV